MINLPGWSVPWEEHVLPTSSASCLSASFSGNMTVTAPSSLTPSQARIYAKEPCMFFLPSLSTIKKNGIRDAFIFLIFGMRIFRRYAICSLGIMLVERMCSKMLAAFLTMMAAMTTVT